MASEFPGPWEIYQPAELDPQLKALAGKSAGLRKRLELLSRDPCHPDVGGYRISGPLAPVVCGAHLDRGYRVAYTRQAASDKRADIPGRVVILYVGKREPNHGPADIWEVLHELFGVTNPPSGHHKPPCCEEDQPAIDEDELAEFRRRLRILNRGRRGSRGRRSRPSR